MAFVYMSMGVEHEALAGLRSAVEINPEQPSYWGAMARIMIAQEQWGEAMKSAEIGLQYDPTNLECLNTRALALLRLGRKGEALDVITDAHGHDPEDALAFTCEGWLYLGRADFKKAISKFQEALRLNPTSKWAREGLLSAAKQMLWVYWLQDQYFRPRGFLMFIGFSFLYSGAACVVLQELKHPPQWLLISILIGPILLWAAVGVFLIVFMLIDGFDFHGHFANLLLSLDPRWQAALTDAEKRDSRLAVVAFVAALLFVFFAVRYHWHFRFSYLMGAVMFFYFCKALGAIRSRDEGQFSVLQQSVGANMLFFPILASALLFDFGCTNEGIAAAFVSLFWWVLAGRFVPLVRRIRDSICMRLAGVAKVKASSDH
jgi:tetratricopeptide (TPR) repeat protein